MAQKSNTIEFLDTRPLYPISESLWVSFCYPLNYSASEKDRIGIYEVGESDIAKSLAAVQIGNPEGHWLLNSGQVRAGKVFLDVSRLPPDDQLQLWYISGDDSEVLGKSEAFSLTMSTPSPFPQSWDSGSRPQSGQLSSIESTSQFGSSFTNVSSTQQSSEFVDVRLPPHSSTSEFTDVGCSPQLISDFVSVQPHSQLNSSFTLVTDGKSFKQLSSEYEIVGSQTTEQTENDQDDQLLLEPLQSKVIEMEEPCDILQETEYKPVPVPRKTKQEDTPSASGMSDLLIDLQEVVEQSQLQTDPPSFDPTPVLSPTTGSGSELLPSPAGSESGSELIQSPAYEVDMSASAVFVDQFTSQKEAKVLKNNNKELRQKIKKLTKLLEDMQHKKQALELQLAEGNFRVSALSDLESKLKQTEISMESLKEHVRLLTSENGTLTEKVSVLRNDCKTQNDRNAKLLSKIQECETLSTVLASENAVLNVKVHHLEEHLQKLKRKEHRKREGERPSSGKRETHEPKEHKNHHAVASKPTKRDHQGSKPKLHESGTKSSEQILQEVRPKPRVHHHHHHHHRTILDDPKHSKPEEKQPPKTSRPTELSLGGIPQPTPAPRHSKGARKEPGASEGQNLLLKETKQLKLPEEPHKVPGEDDTSSLSETRIQEIVSQLRGEELDDIKASSPVAVCPVCQKQLFARESEYGVQLHVEHCLDRLKT